MSSNSATAADASGRASDAVFVPLEQANSPPTDSPSATDAWEPIELDDNSDGSVDQAGDTPLTPAKFHKALEALPLLSDALAAGRKLSQENERLQAQQAMSRLLHGLDGDAAFEELKEEVGRLRERIACLRAANKVLKSQRKGASSQVPVGQGKGKGKGKGKGTDNKDARVVYGPGEKTPLQLDIGRLHALAIALIEGDSPTEIAGQMLDEVDRAGGSEELPKVNVQELRDEYFVDFRSGPGPSASVGRRERTDEDKLHELEGVVDVMLARMAALEDEVRDLKAGQRAFDQV